MDFGIGSVVAITVITYLIGMGCKAWEKLDICRGNPRRCRDVYHAGFSGKGYFKRCSDWNRKRSCFHGSKPSQEAVI